MIVFAAIQRDGVTYIGATGERHHHIIKRMRAAGIDPRRPEAVQGFVTDGGVFLDRDEALRHARLCGQLTGQLLRGSVLTSEDLW